MNWSSPGLILYLLLPKWHLVNYPKAELAELLKPENKMKLADMLNSHVVEGKTHFKDFIDGQKLKNLNGKELSVKISNGDVTINGAKIQGRDNEASNGVVHSLDAVILA